MKRLNPVVVEPASLDDVTPVLDTFNREIRDGVALWNTAERSLGEMTDWFEQRTNAGFPVLIARRSGAYCGFGTFGPFRPHDGYAATVEHSLYVEPSAQGSGVGGRLLEALEREARKRGSRVMIGGLDASNAASYTLHRKQGFTETARMPDVGRKFGRWLTLVFLQKILD